MNSKLVKSDSDRMFAGVCGGIAAYLGIDALLVRVAFIILVFASGVGIVSYLLLMLIMPRAGSVDKRGGEILQDNLADFGDSIATGVAQAGRHPNGPLLAAVFFITIGAWLLLNNFGWISGALSALFLPILMIGIGVWLVRRR